MLGTLFQKGQKTEKMPNLAHAIQDTGQQQEYKVIKDAENRAEFTLESHWSHRSFALDEERPFYIHDTITLVFNLQDMYKCFFTLC